MINIFKNVELNNKLKRERIEVCLNCRKLAKCLHVGYFEHCPNFLEEHDETFVIKKLDG